MIMPAVCHRYHLGNRNGHADPDHERNICCRHHQGCRCKVFITQGPHHRGVDQVEGHLGQLAHDDRDCQLNRFIYFCFLPVAHNSDKACKGNQVILGVTNPARSGFPTATI
jgi:hypothetical protein